jgi:hypothetical protein
MPPRLPPRQKRSASATTEAALPGCRMGIPLTHSSQSSVD